MVMRRITCLVVTALLGSVASVLFAAPGLALPNQSGVDRFGSCLAAQKSGQVLLLIDESGSLKDTDPQAARVTAAKYLTQQLSQFSADSGANIDVAVAGFADDYKQEVGWTHLDDRSLPAVNSGLDAFRDRNTGQDTDYWLALDGARASLAEHQSTSTDGKACQAMVWFTDGKPDYTARSGANKPYAPGVDLSAQGGVANTVAAAKQSICRPGGLADQLRSAGIVTFGIGLEAGSQATDFDVLKSIVTGDASTLSGPCGSIVAPTPGDFYPVQNIDDLLFAFDAFSTPGQPPLETSTGACATTVCDEAKHRFVLDKSVKSVGVLAAADKPGLVPYLLAPNGQQQKLDTGGATPVDVGGVSIDYHWLSDKSVSFRMTNSTAPQWQGVWALVFVDPAGATAAKTKSSIHISGDLFPAWPDQTKAVLHSGDQSVPVTFAVVDSRKKPVDASTLLGKAELSATLVDKDGKQYPIGPDLSKDQITNPQTLSLQDVPPGKAFVRLTLTVTTADAQDQNGSPVPGTALAPQSVDLPVVIDPPVGYPKIGSTVDFGKQEGTGALTSQLTVTGQGCVWIPTDSATKVVAAPDGVTDVAVSSSANAPTNCTKAADGQAASLPLTVSVPHQGNGAVSGTVRVMVAPADASAPPIAIDVPFTASLQKKLDTGSFWIALVVALILGPGIPLLLLYLGKWLASRIPGKALRAEQIPVTLNEASVIRDNRPFAVRDGELVNLVPGLDKPTRRVDLGGVELRTKIGLSPFGGGFVVATAPGMAGAAGNAGATYGKVPDARLPLAVQNTWFVLHDPNGPENLATVVLLVGGDAGPSVINRLVTEVNESLGRVLAELRTRATPTAGPPGEPGPDGQSGPNPFNPSGQSPLGSQGPHGGANPFGPPSPPSGGSGGQFGPSAPAPGSHPFGPSSSRAPNPFGPSSAPRDNPNPFAPGNGPGPDALDPFKPR
jgi:hypothetical protein